MLLHYYVKCTTRYYCAVNNKYDAPNDQQTLHQFIDILNTQLVDTGSARYQTEVRAVRCRNMNSDVACSRIQCREGCVSERCPTERWRLFWELTSGTCMYELVCKSKEDVVSKICDNVNKWLNGCGNLTLYDFAVNSAQFVSSTNVCISQG